MACKELNEYRVFTGPAEHQKAVNSFLGLLDGISIDGIIDEAEIQELRNWYDLHRHLIKNHPFCELLPAIDDALEDGVLTNEEVEDLRWLCQQVSTGKYYDLATCGIQSLQALCYGILADNEVTDEEITQLLAWLEDHSILRGTYPFDEIYSLVCGITEDGVITEDERNTLKAFFAQFVDTRDSYNLNEAELAELREHYSTQGICAAHPCIEVPDHIICFTGESALHTRHEIEDLITSHGGIFRKAVSGKTDYLVVGAEGNPCWAFSCYGRKIEKAMELRKSGGSVAIINEHDFWNTLEG